MKKRIHNNTKSLAILSGITVLEKILSFVFQAMVAALMGASVITDSYFSSAELMTLIDSTLFSGLVIALLNQYTFKLKEEGSEAAFDFLANTRAWVVGAAMLICAAALIFARPIAFVIAPGFDAKGREYLVRDVRIISFVPVLVAMTTSHLAILRQHKDFFVVGLKSLFISVSGIVTLLLIWYLDKSETLSMCYGQLAASFFYCFATGLGCRKYGKLRIQRPRWGEDQIKTLKIWMPLVVSNGLSRVSLMIDRVIASEVGEGSVSCLTYAHSLFNFVHALFIMNLSMILLSDFTNLAAEKKNDELKKRIREALSVLTICLGIVMIVTSFYHEEIVRTVYGRGKFSEASIVKTSELLFIYGLCFVSSAINNIYSSVHYAYGNTSLPMKISMISILLNLLGSVVLTRFIGLNGVAVGTLFASLCTAILYARSMRKLLPGYRGLEKGFLLRCLLGFVLCIMSVMAVHSLLKNPILSFVLATGVGALACFGALLLMKDSYTLHFAKTLVKSIRR